MSMDAGPRADSPPSNRKRRRPRATQARSAVVMSCRPWRTSSVILIGKDIRSPRMMPSASPPTKQERVYREIRERILTGAYGPGFRVVIDVLAEEFGVSALPVREAIRRLEAEGLVIYRPNAGAQVAPVDPGAYDEELSVLAVLEGYATALAAPELGAADIAQLTGLNERMVAAIEEMDSL